MPSKRVYFQADGTNSTAADTTHTQAKALAGPGSLFVYGGDVYDSGTDFDFKIFDDVYGDARPLLAAIPGNHDWLTEDAQGFENYWLKFQPPASCTPVDTSQVGPCRHHYPLSLGNGWLGIFIDCGKDAQRPLTAVELARFDGWLTLHGSRRVIVFLHHARLSRGHHGNNTAIDSLWSACFNSGGSPRVAAWVAGHNHNMGVYSPRARGTGAAADPPLSASIANGVQIFINGAGGAGLYSQAASDGAVGTVPEVFANDSQFGFLQIELKDSGDAVFQNFAVGTAVASPLGPSIDIGF